MLDGDDGGRSRRGRPWGGVDEHYGGARPTGPGRPRGLPPPKAEKAFLALGPPGEAFLKGAAAAGVTKLGVELAGLEAAYGSRHSDRRLRTCGRLRTLAGRRCALHPGRRHPHPPPGALLVPLPIVPNPAAVTPWTDTETPVRATMTCGHCGAAFAPDRPSARLRRCRQAAFRTRRAAPRPAQPTKADTSVLPARPATWASNAARTATSSAAPWAPAACVPTATSRWPSPTSSTPNRWLLWSIRPQGLCRGPGMAGRDGGVLTMAKPRWSRQQAAERRAKLVADAQEVLAAEVKALRSGEDWKRFLEFQSRLHAYSPNNVMLVYAQHAEGVRGRGGFGALPRLCGRIQHVEGARPQRGEGPARLPGPGAASWRVGGGASPPPSPDGVGQSQRVVVDAGDADFLAGPRSNHHRSVQMQVDGDILSFHSSSPCSGTGWFCRHQFRTGTDPSGRRTTSLRRRHP